jgi:hypothetical protein
LQQMREREKNIPTGTMARKYVLQSILTVSRPERQDVRANIWVQMVEKVRCQVVKKIGKAIHNSKLDSEWGLVPKPAVSRIHLLNRMTLPLRNIQSLTRLAYVD